MNKVVIIESTLAETLELGKKIPEFNPPFLTLAAAEEKLKNLQTLFLVAKINDEIAGFKAGYEKTDSFYSWLGGVFPKFRRMGVAKALANYQEAWAKANGYTAITFKTRNCHRNMILFGIKNGFQIIDFQPKAEIEQHRILLRKSLLK